jgi:hypothetical protein
MWTRVSSVSRRPLHSTETWSLRELGIIIVAGTGIHKTDTKHGWKLNHKKLYLVLSTVKTVEILPLDH